jgi:hypothetical protein
MTGDDIEHVNRKKRNRDWVVEVTAKMDRLNRVLSKRRQAVSV